MADKQIDVLYVSRARYGAFSLERVFASVIPRLSETIVCRCHSVPQFRAHPIAIMQNVFSVLFRYSRVVHITGDVHYLAIFLRGRKVVLTIADCFPLEKTRGVKRLLFTLLWYSWPVHFADVVTVISESCKRELLKHVKCAPDKIRVVHVSLPDGFHYVPRAFNAAAPTILHFANHAHKNLKRTVQALNGIPCHLRIIGRISEEENEALRQNNIEFSNVQNLSDAEIIQEYVNCDLLCFPSLYEGFGMPIIEAQAVGRPVVTSGVLSMPEVAGEAACIVDPFSVREIREGIGRMVSDVAYRERMIQKGLENVKRFCPETIAAAYEQIYRELDLP